ncbi:hypothetical protein OKW21_003072 [Catalinimonas alkaloidigena]|uniref:hypothetical protein n=1 Tax=Catalinimonas alkaloidigena TaxID=1075417 RepID=UPI0024065183|nr:hypothetical protein [Catalinimonas alkaloidigena]MDF9797809.1 hypothetical protein [Catalinimonas alkaloidigena]
MYTRIIIMLIGCCSLYHTGMTQNEERNKADVHPTVSFLTAFPAGTFKNDFDRNVLYGFSIGGVITPLKKKKYPSGRQELRVSFSIHAANGIGGIA